MHQGCYVSGVQHQLFLLLWKLVRCKGVAHELSHGLDPWLFVQRVENTRHGMIANVIEEAPIDK